MSTLLKIWQTGFFLLLAALPASVRVCWMMPSALARCIDILESSESPEDSATIQATAELIAILNHYDMSYVEGNIVAGTSKLKIRYASNPLINGLLGDSLVLAADDSESFATSKARRFDLKVNTGTTKISWRSCILNRLFRPPTTCRCPISSSDSPYFRLCKPLKYLPRKATAM